MNPLIAKDNSHYLINHFEEIEGLTDRIADRTLDQLEKEGLFVFPEFISEADDITRKQFILETVNGRYRTGNVMGFLGYGKERLILQSRFSPIGKDYFFQYMLEKVMDFPNIMDMEADVDRDNEIFNFMLFLFQYYLKKAIRKGPFKQYIRNEYNDGNPKGIIDIGRHIKRNTPFTGNISYSQREFSYDNDIMELIRHTIEFIKGKPYGNRLLFSVRSEVGTVIGCTEKYRLSERNNIIVNNKKNSVNHSYYREYRELQRLCILILDHQKHQIGSGLRQIYGIIFDGAWLWEEYINMLIGNLFYHPMNKGGKGAQRLFDNNIGLIYPDFISRSTENRMIADAKYKPEENIGNRDYLQLLAYMFRFDANSGFYLYPENFSKEDLVMRMNKGSTYEKNVSPRDDIRVVKQGLKIPFDSQDYLEFAIKMKASEEDFLERIRFFA